MKNIIALVEYDAQRKTICMPEKGLDSAFKRYIDGVVLPTTGHVPATAVSIILNL